MPRILVVLLVTCINFYTSAQIDTTDWYPLANGNIWQYASTSLFEPVTYITYTVVGDTTFSSGKTYKKIRQVNLDSPTLMYYRFERFEANRVYVPGEVPLNNCTAGENILYDFNQSPGTIWQNCIVYRNALLTHRGLVARGNTNFPTFFNGLLQFASFTDVIVTQTDTNWFPLSSASTSLICKGIGLKSCSGGESAFMLNAAKINGTYYGVLQHIEETAILSSDLLALDMYPNPGNNGTVIEYRIATQAPALFTVFTAIGEKIDEFTMGTKLAGVHSFRYSNPKLSSGIYLVRVTAGHQIATRKLILLK